MNDPFLFPHVIPQSTANPTTVSKQEARRVAPGDRLATTFITRLFQLSGFCDPDSCLGLVSPAGCDESEPALQLQNPVAGWARRNGPSFPSLLKPLVSNSLQLSVNITFWMEWEMSGAGQALTASQMKINSAVSPAQSIAALPQGFTTTLVFLFPAFTLWTSVPENNEFTSKHTHHTRQERAKTCNPYRLW